MFQNFFKKKENVEKKIFQETDKESADHELTDEELEQIVGGLNDSKAPEKPSSQPS